MIWCCLSVAGKHHLETGVFNEEITVDSYFDEKYNFRYK